MTDAEKIEKLIEALNKINKMVFANTIKLGSGDYFYIRDLCVNSIKNVGGKVD